MDNIKNDFRSHLDTYELLIREAQTLGQAIKHAIDFGNHTQDAVAAALHISAAQLSLIINNKRQMSADLIIPFCKVVRNDLLIKWHAYKLNSSLIQDHSKYDIKILAERIEQLELRNDLLEIKVSRQQHIIDRIKDSFCDT